MANTLLLWSARCRRWTPAAALVGIALFGTSAAAAATETSAEPRQRGAAVYQAQHCVRCHALAGKGNRLRPLDDVGARLDAAAIRERVTASPAVQDRFDKRALTAKQKFAKLPAADLDALILFLTAQKAAPAQAPR